MEPKKIIILGSSGSIGRQTLNVVRNIPEIEVVGLAVNTSVACLEEQIQEFSPKLAVVFNKEAASQCMADIPILSEIEGLLELVTLEADLVVAAMDGMEGLLPIVQAIELKKDIAIANKEVLVACGDQLMQLAAKKNVNILPIDSEHSALFQCLEKENMQSVKRLILTASGGPFLHHSFEDLSSITAKNALNHPTWKMGKKNTIDSSTLMNKGLEVIEAHHLFSIPLEKIDVIVHPQSIIHSMVEWIDGSMFAQMSEPSMELPIHYALTYPHRYPKQIEKFDFTKNGTLTFTQPDRIKFKCLSLAYEALKIGGSMPCFMNAVNEELVQLFLEEKISWLDIGNRLEDFMQKHETWANPSIEECIHIDKKARIQVASI